MTWEPSRNVTNNNNFINNRQENLIRIQCRSHLEIINMKVISMNARSVKNKAADIASFITDEQIDILVITETWLRSGEGDKVVKGELVPKGYKLIHAPRVKRRGGGVGIVIRNDIRFEKQNITQYSAFESLEGLIHSANDCIRLCVIYRPPYSGTHGEPTDTFIEQFHQYIEHHVTTNGKLVITGDFNFHMDDPNNTDTKKFQDLLFSLNMKQHINDATHEHGHILDLVITRSEESELINDIQIHGTGISDHFPCEFILPWKKPSPPKKRLQLRRLKDINLESMKKDIQESSLIKSPPNNLSNLVDMYNETLKTILEKHAPTTTKEVIDRQRSPWYCNEIKQTKRDRRKAERRWRKSKLIVHYDILKEHRKLVNQLCSKAKSTYYCSKFQQHDMDQKKLYQLANDLLHRKENAILPTHKSPTDLADHFAEFFTDKIKKIRTNLAPDLSVNITNMENTAAEIPKMQQLSKIADVDLKKIIQKGNSKSCQLDPIPTTLLKQLLPTLLSTLSDIVNTSMTTVSMPYQLKTATVTPLLKKSTADPEDFKSYRPISNLPYLGKIIEKVVVSQIDEHMVANSLVEPLQSAYRKNHSTETALIKINNDLLISLDNKKCIFLVLLDLSAAFDTIDHSTFIDRLEQENGITGDAKNWLISYFADRHQSVYINGASSKQIKLDTGFPQGSYIGPSGFKAYTKPLTSIAEKHGISIHLYADDTQLYAEFDDENMQEVLKRLENCISDIRLWMTSNFLKLNDDKTEFMIIGDRLRLSRIGAVSLKIGNQLIMPSPTARNIGAVFDETMSMENQVSSVCHSCYTQLRYIYQIRKHLTLEAAKTLVHSFVASRLDNLNSLVYGVPQTLINKLQKVQNSAARVVLQIRKYDHITPVLQYLHWLPVEYRIKYKLITLTQKALHGQAPDYLCEMIKLHVPNRHLRSGSEYKLDNKMYLPRVHKYGDRTFIVSAAKLWNSLPFTLRKLGMCNDNQSTFKMKLKTHLYNCAFDL